MFRFKKKDTTAIDKKEIAKKIFLYIVFALYILILFKLVFLSRSVFLDDNGNAFRSINIIPFQTIMEYLYIGADGVKRFSLMNIGGNIAAFIPLGMYLPLFKKNKKIGINLLLVFLTSLFVEIIQWIFAVGVADIDDLILNSLGGLLGILVYKLVSLIFKKEKKIQTAYVVISAIILPIILYLLFAIQLRF